ncbi:Aste57867_23363 [Aphanomyces stellatus]|uniref:mitogen-activated protein kinase kinase n=1 Tax=Aphanomyces stellatus TaxID=120398 RepID=A0A485LPD4_9STRA|nr:hypothetical protein As57867_023292 [Aphanomyces stellatus]VFU00009.1 Aste57867_23363 [Aphanomyces stellatus]
MMENKDALLLPQAPPLPTATSPKSSLDDIASITSEESRQADPPSAPPAAPTSVHKPKMPRLLLQLSSQNVIDTKGKPGAFANLKKENKGKKSADASPETILEAVRGDGPADLASDVERLKKLGKGAGGTVYLGCFVPTLKLIAVKEVQLFHAEDFAMVTHELHALHDNLVPLEDAATHKSIELLGKLFHRKLHIGNVHSCRDLVSFYGAYATPQKSSVSIAMEYMDAGTLQDFMGGAPLTEPVLKHIAFCTMRALRHMHVHNMIHRDIKPANILINARGDFKIADFGLAATLSKSKSYFSEFQGTLMYMSPERMTGQNYSFPSDVWAIGITLLSLARGAYPFDVADGFFGLEDAIVNEEMPPAPNTLSPACRDFIQALLAKAPDARLTPFQALDHPFLQSYDPANEAFADAWAALYSPASMPSQEIDSMVHVILSQARPVPAVEFDFHPDFLLHYPPDSSSHQLSLKHLANLADACRTTTQNFLATFARLDAARTQATAL